MCESTQLGGAFLAGVLWTLAAVGAWIIAHGFREAHAMKRRQRVEPNQDAP